MRAAQIKTVVTVRFHCLLLRRSLLLAVTLSITRFTQCPVDVEKGEVTEGGQFPKVKTETFPGV